MAEGEPAWTDDFPVDRQGHLEIGGVRASALAGAYGTPLYVIDGHRLRTRMAEFRDALAPLGGTATYAGKALLTSAVARLVAAEGLWLDVVSGGELYLALRAGMPAERMLVHGNNKSEEELVAAVEAGAGRIVVDSLPELERLGAVAARLGRRPAVLLRVAPGVEGGAHHHIQTGQEDSKFGLGLRSGDALEAVRRALVLPSLALKGLHCHIGSQILDLTPFERATDAMLAFCLELKATVGYWPEELDLGGGLGIRYLPTDRPPSVADYVRATAGRAHARARAEGLPVPRTFLEPGRAIVGEAGVTLYSVGDRKVVPGVRTYVALDGGMGDNPRPALYGARYSAALVDRADAPSTEAVTLAGRYCESGDILASDVWLPDVRPGDVIALFSTGAYTLSMASTYNRVPRPALVWVEDGTARLVVRRETYEDLYVLEDPDAPALPAPVGDPAASGRKA